MTRIRSHLSRALVLAESHGGALRRWARAPALLVGAIALGCACPAPPPAAPPPASPPSTAASAQSGAVDDAFAAPVSLAPASYFVLGPFPKLAGETSAHESLDHDYLAPLGGEAAARIDAGTTLTHAGVAVRSVGVASPEGVVDLAALYQPLAGAGAAAPSAVPPTNDKVAYAYAELELPAAELGHARFGSDDGAVVWVNGARVHRVVANRALGVDDDRFDVPLVAGKNRILVKVDNGYGGWAFSLRLFDAAGRQRLAAIARRRDLAALGPVPVGGSHLLGSSLPDIVFADREGVALVFGDGPPTVRWFGPDLVETHAVGPLGRYTALLEGQTRDGYPFRRMLAFARVPGDTVPWTLATPFDRELKIPLPGYLPLAPAALEELGHVLWLGGQRTLLSGEGAAILANALFETRADGGAPRSPARPGDGIERHAAHQLALRMRLEGRAAKPLPPPARLATPAGTLTVGSERAAGMKPGTVAKLRAVTRDWAKADPNGFTVLVARRGVVFLHEGYNGFAADQGFFPASIGKTIAGLLFARAVDQGLVTLDQPLASVFPTWDRDQTRAVTFRHCFYHLLGLPGHLSHGGLLDPYLDQTLLTADVAFARPGTRFVYGGDELNLTGKALELITGQTVQELLRVELQAPFGEPVVQHDLGVGTRFTALYLAKIGQMLIQDGAYGQYRFFRPGFVRELWPRRVADFAPALDNSTLENGIGLEWKIDPPGPRERGALGPNVVGHGSASGSVWRIAPDHQLVLVVGRDAFASPSDNETFTTRLVQAVAEGLK
ncbi:MAG TPA: serine hydrolase [Polyangiaceae bacterium]|nr:serine hydrolase [Polyangiaceae bacterium]